MAGDFPPPSMGLGSSRQVFGCPPAGRLLSPENTAENVANQPARRGARYPRLLVHHTRPEKNVVQALSLSLPSNRHPHNTVRSVLFSPVHFSPPYFTTISGPGPPARNYLCC